MSAISIKLIIAAPIFGLENEAALVRLREAGFDPVDLRPGGGLDEAARSRALAQAEALILGNAPRLDEAFLRRAPKLRWVAKMGVGLDNIDLDAATRRNVLVFSTPGTNTEAVADYAWALLLALARQVSEADRLVRSGQWRKLRGFQVHGKTLGLIGLGAIGRAVARRAGGFGMRLLGLDPFWPKAAQALGVERVDLDRLLAEADFVSLHCPLTPATQGLIGPRALALMKPTALLINTARGALVDEAALAAALQEGRLGGAALDALAQEPPPLSSPLLDAPNLLLSPHTAWYTAESLAAINEGVVDGLLALLNGQSPAHPANTAGVRPSGSQ